MIYAEKTQNSLDNIIRKIPLGAATEEVLGLCRLNTIFPLDRQLDYSYGLNVIPLKVTNVHLSVIMPVR